MSTSGSYNFQFTRAQIIREALDLIGALPQGKEPTAIQTSDAARKLNVVVQSLTIDGIRLWTQERTNALYVATVLQTTLTSGTASYELAMDTLEVAAESTVIRHSGFDTKLVPLSVHEYQLIDQKTLSGLPTSYLVEWNVANVNIASGKTFQGGLRMTFWPVPNDSTDQVHYVRTRKLADFDAQNNDPDAPVKWTRCLIYGLAYELALRDGMPPADRKEILEQFKMERERLRFDDSPRGNLTMCPGTPEVWR